MRPPARHNLVALLAAGHLLATEPASDRTATEHVRTETTRLLLTKSAPATPGPTKVKRNTGPNGEPPTRLPGFEVTAKRVVPLEQKLKELSEADRIEKKARQDIDTPLQAFWVVRDPDARARAKLADLRLRVSEQERLLLIAASASKDPAEVERMIQLIKETRMLRSNQGTDLAFFNAATPR